MKVKELLAKQGQSKRVYCGCIGWVSGFPRSTEGRVAWYKGWTYYYCENCDRFWKKHSNENHHHE
jgi:hypothetical protein